MDRATLIRLLGLCASVSLCEKKSAAQSAAHSAAKTAAHSAAKTAAPTFAEATAGRQTAAVPGEMPACAKCPFKEKVKAFEALARKPPGGH